MRAREKGSVAEREVAALIEPWWRRVEEGCVFIRTPLSGGWGRPEHREGFGTAGDLMTDAITFPFAVEVKRREGWVWKTLLKGKPSPIWEWWRQTQKAALEMHKRPMLWFRHNREPWAVFIPRELDDRVPVAFDPVRYWKPSELRGVDYGNVVPVCYWGESILEMPPKLFLEDSESRRGRRR